METQFSTLQVGDLIGIGCRPNNHGCRDFAVLRYDGNGKATVLEAASCTSCWQVSHDADHVFAAVGDTWDVDPAQVSPAGEAWSRDVKWEV
jgi:hypothetical protein